MQTYFFMETLHFFKENVSVLQMIFAAQESVDTGIVRDLQIYQDKQADQGLNKDSCKHLFLETLHFFEENASALFAAVNISRKFTWCGSSGFQSGNCHNLKE